MTVKSSPIVVDLILTSVSAGSSLLRACEQAGIDRSTFYRWINDDKSLALKYADSVRQQTLLKWG